MAFKDYREESRTNWGTSQEQPLTLDQINTGCMLRIADATEKMAQNYDQLIRERNMFKSYHEEERERRQKRDRQITALRGVITKLKKKEANHE